jgi:[ribosomal protein S18]-alanine N-acetyltransferase
VSEPHVRLIQPGDADALTELFASLDETYFHPHPLTAEEARRLVAYRGEDVYAVLDDGDALVAYGILRGWDVGFAIPSLGVGVRKDRGRQGFGRVMMDWLADEARRRGADRIRLRVHPDNAAALGLYERLGYEPTHQERGEIVMVLDLNAPA